MYDSETPLGESRGYHALRRVLLGLFQLLFRLEVHGAEHVPPAGPVILAPNHVSQLDPIVVAIAIPRRVTFLATHELLPVPIVGWIVRRVNPVFVDRAKPDIQAVRACTARLAAGQALLIYPEGRISEDGQIQEGRLGTAFLAYRTGAPVVPMGLRGVDEALPLGKYIPRLRRVSVHIGAPIYPRGEASRENLRRLTGEVIREIAALSGRGG